MRTAPLVSIIIVTMVVAAVVVMMAFRDEGSEGTDRKLPFIAPGLTGEIRPESASLSLGELLERSDVAYHGLSFRAYTERGEILRVQLGTTIHWEDGKARLDDGTALLGIASVDLGSPGTLMSIAPTVLSSMDITNNLKEPPLTSAGVERVVVLELDGLGWSLLMEERGLLRNISSVGNISAALTAFPPRTNTGTAMALSGYDPLHNGILTRDDRELTRPTFLGIAASADRSMIWIEGDRSILSEGAVLNVDLNADGSVDDEIFSTLMGYLGNGTEVIMAHFHSIDDSFHSNGPGSDALLTSLKEVDAFVGRTIENIKGSGVPTLLVLFSDHGLHGTGEGTGGHGSFRHEDMYAFFSFRTFCSTTLADRTVLTVRTGGDRVGELTIEDLEALPFSEAVRTVRSSNGETAGLYRGIELWDLLDHFGTTGGSGQIVMTARDGLLTSVPWDWAGEGSGTMLAYSMDGDPLPKGVGPLRLIVPQELAGEYNGQYCLKDVTVVEVTV